jgi:hypothetical protein
MGLGSALLISAISIFLLAAFFAAGSVITFFAMWVVEVGDMVSRSWLRQFAPSSGRASR